MKSFVPSLPKLLVFVLLSVSVMFTEQTMGQECANTFFGTVLQLMPCRPAVAAFGADLPNESCCNALNALGQPCLCALVNGVPIAGLDRSMALQLPAKCALNFDPCTAGP